MITFDLKQKGDFNFWAPEQFLALDFMLKCEVLHFNKINKKLASQPTKNTPKTFVSIS